MALPSKIYRFRVDLSDVDRGVYEAVDIRVAQHPSETLQYLMTRVLAYLLELEEGLDMARGLSVPDEPALWRKDLTGVVRHWIEVGSPSPERLHQVSKANDRLSVYTYKDPEILREQVAGTRVHEAEAIGCWALAPAFLDELAGTLGRNNDWTVVHTAGELYVSVGERSIVGRREAVRLESGG